MRIHFRHGHNVAEITKSSGNGVSLKNLLSFGQKVDEEPASKVLAVEDLTKKVSAQKHTPFVLP